MDDVHRVSLDDTIKIQGVPGGVLGRGRESCCRGRWHSSMPRTCLVTMTEMVPLSTTIFVDSGVFLTPGSVRLAIPAS